MGKTLVTGATGLIGSHVVKALLARGDDVRATVRPRSRLDNIADLDALETVSCDVLDRRAVRRALTGVDRVFHCAGMTSLRASQQELERVNVGGTRVVLEEALNAGVERLVFTSSFAAVGPATRGSTADETQVWRAGRHGLAYVNAKHAAEIEALRLGAKGLPVVVVNPAHVLGPGDVNRSSTELVRRFLRRELPAYVDGAVCIVHPADVAAGQLLADERGTIGERYILGNRNFTLDRLFADLSRLSGVEPPALKLPLPAAIALARSSRALPVGPNVVEAELRAMSLWWAFRSTKAKRELGYKPRHHEDALVETIAWFREREADGLCPPGTRQPLALRLAGFAERRAESIFSTLRG
jgi:dihydroflavonol-4-reductase